MNFEIILNTNILISMLWLLIQKWRKAGIFHVGARRIYGRKQKHNILIRKFNENYSGDPKVDERILLKSII